MLPITPIIIQFDEKLLQTLFHEFNAYASMFTAYLGHPYTVNTCEGWGPIWKNWGMG